MIIDYLCRFILNLDLNMKKLGILLLFGLIFIFPTAVCAQVENCQGGDPSLSIKVDARFDGEQTTYGDGLPSDGGFAGRYLKVLVNGKINSRFSYSFRHRLYVAHQEPKSFFNATDWANVTYHHNDRFTVTAGKQMVCIGTIEYDYAPIDVYFASDFWNHVSPFQIGVNVGYKAGDNHQFYAQVVNSPFSQQSMENIYAYNLIWYGRLAPWYNTIWSVNMIEYEKDHFINYIALGNKFHFGKTSVDLDYMNRYAGKDTDFFDDFSLHGKVSYAVNGNVNIFAKGGYDVNRGQKEGASFVYDRYVLPGVDLGFYGAGVEYFPIKTDKQALRIHAFWCSNTSDADPQTFNVGVRWQMDILNR